MTTAGLLVMAKAPVPGSVKTRLAAAVGFDAAADLAAAALLDTLESGEQAFPRSRRVLAIAGDLELAMRCTVLRHRLTGWQLQPQRGDGLGARLAHAHQGAAGILPGPVVQIGMDTPHVEPDRLRTIGRDLDGGRRNVAVLGPAVDGGWWVLGLPTPAWASGLAGVAMSSPDTCRETQALLHSQGARVVSAPVMRDVDTPADAELVARQAPHTRFARTWQTLGAPLPPPTDVLDDALSGAACLAHGLPGGPVPVPVPTWRAGCDSTDRVMVDRCKGPTLDVGCGPGRLTEGLGARGVGVLGIDLSEAAVRQTRNRGVHALRRDIFQPVPAEGRWESVLLADGNVGIGGDPARLLARVRDLLGPEGRAVVEVAAPGTPLSRHRLQIEAAGRVSAPFSWAILGPEALAAIARRASLDMLRVIGLGGRWFAELQKTGRGQCRM